MRPFRKYWKSLSFQKKLIFTFLPLALIPMIFLTGLSSWIYSNQTSESINRNVGNTVNLVNEHLNTYLNELTRLSVLPYYNSKILEIMQETGNISDVDYSQIQTLLSQAIRNPREDLQSVAIYRNDGQIFSSSLYNASINYQYDFMNSDWYQRAVEANGKVVFTGKVNDTRIINRPEPAFSVARAIKIYNGPILGVVIIDVSFTGLENIFQTVNLGNNANIVVLDDKKNIIYSKNNVYLSVVPNLHFENKSVQFEGDKLITSQIQSANTGWTIAGIASEAELNQGKATLYKIIATAASIVFIAVLLVSIFISNTMTKPLKTLRMLMGKVEMGDFNVAYQSLDGNLEIGQVGRAFNKMNQRIDELVNQVLEIRYKQKEAELNNLKLQIRPHFLFNNLEAIRALAEMGDREGIVEITSALGGMLRYSLNKQNSKVTLRQEVQQVQNYIRIEQIRSGNKLSITYDIDRTLLSCITIPILIQPVVENCIHHAFDQAEGLRQIQLSLTTYDEGIIIRILDNGIGMTANSLSQLIAYLDDKTEELSFGNSGIGLKNLHSRIQLEYGSKYGLSIISTYQEGMNVAIRIPRMEGKI